MVVELFWIHSLDGTEVCYVILTLQGASLKQVMSLLYGRHIFLTGMVHKHIMLLLYGRHIFLTGMVHKHIMLLLYGRHNYLTGMAHKQIMSLLYGCQILLLSTLLVLSHRLLISSNRCFILLTLSTLPPFYSK